MVEYQITVSLNGKFLFRTEMESDRELAMANVVVLERALPLAVIELESFDTDAYDDALQQLANRDREEVDRMVATLNRQPSESEKQFYSNLCQQFWEGSVEEVVSSQGFDQCPTCDTGNPRIKYKNNFVEPTEPYPFSDKERLDYLESNMGVTIQNVGNRWYFRKGYRHPHKKAKSLRHALDSAMSFGEEKV